MPQTRVLVVEDDDIVRTLLAANLETAGHAVATACSGAEMAEALRDVLYDLVLLDLGLPDEDGIVLLRQIRARGNMPVIVLTSREEMADRHAALELGADDYISKQVHPDEIMLRVRNVLRRSAGAQSGRDELAEPQTVVFSGWRLDPAGRTLFSPSGAPVDLTGAEFDVLSVLARAPNRVLTRDYLLDGMMRIDSAPMDRMVDSYISRIRKKMGDPRFIVTVTGIGYRFVPEPD